MSALSSLASITYNGATKLPHPIEVAFQYSVSGIAMSLFPGAALSVFHICRVVFKVKDIALEFFELLGRQEQLIQATVDQILKTVKQLETLNENAIKISTAIWLMFKEFYISAKQKIYAYEVAEKIHVQELNHCRSTMDRLLVVAKIVQIQVEKSSSVDQINDKFLNLINELNKSLHVLEAPANTISEMQINRIIA